MLGDGTTFVNFGQKPIRGNARCLYEPHHEKKCKLTDQEGSRIGDSENLFNISSIKLFPFSVHSNDRQIHWPNIPLFAQLKRIFLLSFTRNNINSLHFSRPPIVSHVRICVFCCFCRSKFIGSNNGKDGDAELNWRSNEDLNVVRVTVCLFVCVQSSLGDIEVKLEFDRMIVISKS